MIQQFTYTASPWGKSGAGWQIFQQSPNVPADVAKKLHEVYRYEELKRPTGGEAHPIQFVYLPSQSGDGAVLAQTAFTGMRWWGDPRPGDFFAHVLLLDKDAVEKSCKVGFNPVRLFMSPKLQSAFPADNDNDLKETALRIFRKETAWEAPPELPELQSLSDLPENPQLAFDKALCNITERAAQQLGALVRAIVLRTTGNSDKPIVFDSGNKSSPFVMTLALDLIPPAWRAQTWFAVHFTESALRRLPNFNLLTFYGTDGTASSDLNSGIASGVDFAEDPFGFLDRNDVRAFKKQLDLIGSDVSLNDYMRLIDCRSVSSGKSRDLASLRSAMSFAARFPGLKDEIDAGLEKSLATNTHSADDDFHVFAAVAWFECGLKAFEDHAKRVCSVCIYDLALLDKVTQELKDDAVFVNAVVDAAKNDAAKKNDIAAFVNRIVESKTSFEMAVSKRNEDDLFRLAVEYKRVLSDVHESRVKESFTFNAETALNTVNALLSVAGSEVKDISEEKKYLEYRQDIAKIQKIDEVFPTLEKYVEAGFPSGANPRRDVLGRISASSVQEIVKFADILYKLKFEKDGMELIRDLWKADQAKWKADQATVKQLATKLQELENREPEETKKSGCLFPLIVLVIGIALGFFVGKKFGSSKVEKVSLDDYLPQRVFVEPNGNQGKDDKKNDKLVQMATNKAATVEVKASGRKQGKDDKKSDKPVQTATNKTATVEVKASGRKQGKDDKKSDTQVQTATNKTVTVEVKANGNAKTN